VNAWQIFKTYFKNRVLFLSAIFLIIFSYRVYKDHHISWDTTIIIFSLFLVCILYFGFSDYWFYEKSLKKIIQKLLSQAPLKNFEDKGFEFEEEDKLVGFINDFNVSLSPMAKIGGEKYLIILIPLELRDDMEKYFKKFDEFFRISFSGNLLLAQAVIKNYDKDFAFEKLYSIIQSTTELLKERNIQPITLIED
jgi:hypothetical protein